jgi:ATP-dependent DNA helicase RecG
MIAEIKAGHQVYVVTPLINESESIDTANATKIYENMERYFKGIATVGLLHGKMKPEERECVMARFLKNEVQILVATSVIEVGVNVINATTIVVLGAERFGVAQLHQLRGRVMRSDAVPYCFLISDSATESALERLKMVEETSDGFKLADYDLKMRGPGEFFGEKQSGAMSFKFADLKEDAAMFDEANVDADEIISNPKFETDEQFRSLNEYVKLNYQLKKSELD